jgi:hypothetical protein
LKIRPTGCPETSITKIPIKSCVTTYKSENL